MTIRHYLTLLKRWWWLMAAGLLLGLLGGVIYSFTLSPVYRASARLLFTQQAADGYSAVSSSSGDRNVAATLSKLLVSRPVLDEAGQQLGIHIEDRRVKAGQVLTSRVIELTVLDSRPERAALAANTILNEFIRRQAELRAGLFASEEEGLKAQIQQIQAQIDALQAQSIKETTMLKEQQITGLEKEISALRQEINDLQSDAILLELGGTPVPGYDRSLRQVMLQPTLTVDQQVILAAKMNRLEEARRLLDLYQNVYIDLLFGRNAQKPVSGGSDSTTLTLELYQNIYASLLDNYEAIRLARRNSTPDLVVVDTAHPAEAPVRPSRLVSQVVGALAGLALAGLLAFVLVLTDETIRTAEEARSLLRLPVLGALPPGWARKQRPAMAQPRPEDLVVNPLPVPVTGQAAGQSPQDLMEIPVTGQRAGFAGIWPEQEGLRFLHSNLEHIFTRQDIRIILISSPSDTQAVAQLSMRLALLSAQVHRPVVLVDADFHDPKVASWLEMEGWTGLWDVLVGKEELQSVIRQWDGTCLSVISAGRHPDDPSILLDQAALKKVFADLRQLDGLVVVIGPSFEKADAVTLAAQADGVLLALELNRTRATAALAAVGQCGFIHANVVGMTLL